MDLEYNAMAWLPAAKAVPGITKPGAGQASLGEMWSQQARMWHLLKRVLGPPFAGASL